MYKCLNPVCGHIFDEGEEWRWTERHGFEHGPFETLAGCPVCRSAYEETVRCEECGSEHLSDELYEGICDECLRDSITYDTMFSYLIETDDALLHFMFHHYFDSDVPKTVSARLLTALKYLFFSLRDRDKIRGDSTFLLVCKNYIMDSDGDFGRNDFAQWMKEKDHART